MEFEPVIGFEVHAELGTATKVFCGCRNEFGVPPNTNVCPVCLGLPGALPVLNRTAAEYAIRAAIALNCTINEHAAFDRKNYYYPDLPKNYQISEQHAIIGVDGWIDIPVGGAKQRVRINNVHLEEDAGKLVHPESAFEDYSMVDLNRAGAPLLEIVSEPDLRSKDEALSYMNTLRNLLLYTGISEAQMQKGQLRFELNISVRPKGATELGKKVELKNLNSMRTVLRCIDYEFARQVELLESGGAVRQETRLWDEKTFETRAMRSKEGSPDYRYFPDPDLVELNITPQWQEEIRAQLPELQHAKCERFVTDYQLPPYDAEVLTTSKPVGDYFEQAVAAHRNPKSISNWMMTEILRVLKERDEEEASPYSLKIQPRQLGELVALIDGGTISGKLAKQIFAAMLENGKTPAAIVAEQGLAQISDESALAALVEQAIADNPGPAQDFRNGKDKALAALVGRVMKLSQGKANPQLVNELLRQKLRP